MIAPACKHELTKKFGRNRNGTPRVRCSLCGKTWTEAPKNILGTMRIELALAEQILKCLCEGNSIRSTARLTNTNPHTVIDLMMLVGGRCARYMEVEFRNISVEDVQCDEAWQFIFCKQKTAEREGYGKHVGDSYVFTAIERGTKLLVTWHLGKRDQWNTDIFCHKLANATVGKFQISTDGFAPYLSAVVRYLGNRVEHGTVVKTFGKSTVEDQRKYSPGKIIAIKKEAAFNLPNMDRVCTSHIERHNLTLRTFVRRMTRLSCAFSKKWENHEAMMGLAIFHYNFVRVHGAIKTTPAVKSGLTSHRWTVRQMIELTATH